MSLNAFKEALKPCKSTQSSSSSSSSRIPLGLDPSIQSRKPPKSSLSSQFLRLHKDADFLESNGFTISKPEPKPQPERERVRNLNPRSGDDECEEEKEVEIRPTDFKLESLRPFDHVGPYEPLVLSSSPVVQVIFRVQICLQRVFSTFLGKKCWCDFQLI